MYDRNMPDTLNQQYKDLFSMTLNVNPSKRANIESILKKIEEKNIREPSLIGSCACFPSRRILSSSKSTISLVQKVLSSDFKSSKDESITKLITKV